MSWQFYAGSLAAMALGQLIYALRWKSVLSAMGVAIRYAVVVQQYLIGLFFTNVMPTAVGGDAAKVYLLGRTAGYVEIGASVFVDRVLGFLWLSVLGATLAWLTIADSPVLVMNRNLLTIFAAIFAGALLVAKLVPLDGLIRRLVPARFSGVTAAATTFDGLVRRGVLAWPTVAFAGVVVGGYAWQITMVYQSHFAANGVASIATPLVMLVVISMSIFVNVPISVNGIGLREQLHVLLFTGLGVPKEVSVSLSLLLFAHQLVLSLAGCALWLRLRPAA
jgi:uncharacterized membrane protein YbhN (UPF0104 family)